MFSEYRIFYEKDPRDYVEYIRALPDVESPQIMGLHENASIQ